MNPKMDQCFGTANASQTTYPKNGHVGTALPRASTSMEQSHGAASSSRKLRCGNPELLEVGVARAARAARAVRGQVEIAVTTKAGVGHRVWKWMLYISMSMFCM